MLEAEQLPARVPDLRARLAHVDEDRLTHGAWLSVTSRKLEEQRARRFLQRGPRGKKLSHAEEALLEDVTAFSLDLGEFYA